VGEGKDVENRVKEARRDRLMQILSDKLRQIEVSRERTRQQAEKVRILQAASEIAGRELRLLIDQLTEEGFVDPDKLNDQPKNEERSGS